MFKASLILGLLFCVCVTPFKTYYFFQIHIKSDLPTKHCFKAKTLAKELFLTQEQIDKIPKAKTIFDKDKATKKLTGIMIEDLL